MGYPLSINCMLLHYGNLLIYQKKLSLDQLFLINQSVLKAFSMQTIALRKEEISNYLL